MLIWFLNTFHSLVGIEFLPPKLWKGSAGNLGVSNYSTYVVYIEYILELTTCWLKYDILI